MAATARSGLLAIGLGVLRRAAAASPREAAPIIAATAILAAEVEREAAVEREAVTRQRGLPPERAAELFGVSVNSVRRWCREGRIGHRLHKEPDADGGWWIIPEWEVAAVLAYRAERGCSTFAAVLRLRQPG